MPAAARNCALMMLVALCLPSGQFSSAFTGTPVGSVGARARGARAASPRPPGARARRARAPGCRRDRTLAPAAAAGAGLGGRDAGEFPRIEELNPFLPGSREGDLAEALMERLQVDDAQQRRRIEQTPQGTQEWLDARKYRLTASNFGAAAGRNRFRSPEQLVQDMLYGEFKGNDATRWGSQMESVALDAYVARKQGEIAAGGGDKQAFRVTQSGLHVCAEAGWLAGKRV